MPSIHSLKRSKTTKGQNRISILKEQSENQASIAGAQGMRKPYFKNKKIDDITV